MKSRRIARYLRIAVTALSLTACVLLIVLWVRSYWRFDQIIHRASAKEYVALTTIRGQIAIGGSDDRSLATVFKKDWTHRGFSLNGRDTNPTSPFPVFVVSILNSSLVVGSSSSKSYELMFPFWVLVLTSVVFGASPWLNWRFSLRTLLIATTLVAVALWIIISTS